jgi:cytidine deaminase
MTSLYIPNEKHPSREVDPYSTFISSVPTMVELARSAAANEARSYRKFHVGAAIFAVNHDLNRLAIFAGANTKLSPADPKYCAEMNVIDQAEQAGCDEAIGIVVAATGNKQKIKEVTGKATDTLHPCMDCIQKFEDSPIVHEDTFILTAATDAKNFQVHTVNQIQDVYTGSYDDSIAPFAPTRDIDFEFGAWPMRQSMYDYVGSLRELPAWKIPKATRREMARVALTSMII